MTVTETIKYLQDVQSEKETPSQEIQSAIDYLLELQAMQMKGYMLK